MAIRFKEAPALARSPLGSAPALRALESQARRRGEGAPDLAGRVFAILAGDPVPLANVLDDGS